jgi:hypothetical protein
VEDGGDRHVPFWSFSYCYNGCHLWKVSSSSSTSHTLAVTVSVTPKGSFRKVLVWFGLVVGEEARTRIFKQLPKAAERCRRNFNPGPKCCWMLLLKTLPCSLGYSGKVISQLEASMSIGQRGQTGRQVLQGCSHVPFTGRGY